MKLKELINFRLYSGNRIHSLKGCWNVKVNWNESLKYAYANQNINMKKQNKISKFLGGIDL